MLGIALAVVLWTMPLWMLQYYLVRLGLADIVPILLPPLDASTRGLAIIMGGLIMAGAAVPLLWGMAQYIWPRSQRVTVSPLPTSLRPADAEPVPAARADCPPFPKFLGGDGDSPVQTVPAPAPAPAPVPVPVPAPVPRVFAAAPPVLLPEPDPVLILDTPPVRPEPAYGLAPSTDAKEASVAELLDRFERRLSDIRRRGADQEQPMRVPPSPGQRPPYLASAAR